MRLQLAIAVAMGLAFALAGAVWAFADPAPPRVAGAEAKCVAYGFSRSAMTSDGPLCRRGAKNGKTNAGTAWLQFPQVWEMTAAAAWEAFPAAGLSAAVSGTPRPPFSHPFVNGGAGPAVLNAKLDGKSGAAQAGQGESKPKWSFTGDIGIPNNHSLEDVLRQQYRGPAAMDNDSVTEKFVNAIGALKLGIKVDY